MRNQRSSEVRIARLAAICGLLEVAARFGMFDSIFTWAAGAEDFMPLGTWGEWIGAIATFMAVAVALFSKEILEFIGFRPKLTLELRLDDHAGTYPMGPEPAHWFRLWVQNDGSIRATHVQLFVRAIHVLENDQRRKWNKFIPIKLS